LDKWTFHSDIFFGLGPIAITCRHVNAPEFLGDVELEYIGSVVAGVYIECRRDAFEIELHMGYRPGYVWLFEFKCPEVCSRGQEACRRASTAENIIERAEELGLTDVYSFGLEVRLVETGVCDHPLYGKIPNLVFEVKWKEMESPIAISIG